MDNYQYTVSLSVQTRSSEGSSQLHGVPARQVDYLTAIC